jgi:hypothetical protein
MYHSTLHFMDTRKAVCFVGTSGCGKSLAAEIFSLAGAYVIGIDHQIWTGLHAELTATIHERVRLDPVLGELLDRGSIKVTPDIYANIGATALFMGMPGSPLLGGLPLPEFLRRGELHYQEELKQMQHLPTWALIAQEDERDICIDASGSLCHVAESSTAAGRQILEFLRDNFLVVYIEPRPDEIDELISIGAADPKPIYYPAQWLKLHLPQVLSELAVDSVEQADPKAVGARLFRRLIEYRLALYREMVRTTNGIILPKGALYDLDYEAAIGVIAAGIDRRDLAMAGRN